MTEKETLTYYLIKRLRAIRKERNISQEQLSELAGVESRYINKLENGKLNPTLNTLEKIMLALDISYRELFELSSHETDIESLLVALAELSPSQRKVAINAFIELLSLEK
ncbi:helix-turn-helix domain-containing protein [Streptococcus loxodontisalivarius]|uniref:Transcriptional regulator with XRE-family HTH domain n=1 Tax=Streptococcus loxodontisalivarius TaxID=1349415 RepID=A0ABS2PW15_9STRE|nr:helix-turn-helix transcriptional regulator [Streptococcus loxodontisalivarius]MBM7643725.1 transcriptional regulator with XRE-family HTH domain [Streptococcus loxodontisalivarius]